MSYFNFLTNVRACLHKKTLRDFSLLHIDSLRNFNKSVMFHDINSVKFLLSSTSNTSCVVHDLVLSDNLRRQFFDEVVFKLVLPNYYREYLNFPVSFNESCDLSYSLLTKFFFQNGQDGKSYVYSKNKILFHFNYDTNVKLFFDAIRHHDFTGKQILISGCNSQQYLEFLSLRITNKVMPVVKFVFYNDIVKNDVDLVVVCPTLNYEGLVHKHFDSLSCPGFTLFICLPNNSYYTSIRARKKISVDYNVITIGCGLSLGAWSTGPSNIIDDDTELFFDSYSQNTVSESMCFNSRLLSWNLSSTDIYYVNGNYIVKSGFFLGHVYETIDPDFKFSSKRYRLKDFASCVRIPFDYKGPRFDSLNDDYVSSILHDVPNYYFLILSTTSVMCELHVYDHVATLYCASGSTYSLDNVFLPNGAYECNFDLSSDDPYLIFTDIISCPQFKIINGTSGMLLNDRMGLLGRLFSDIRCYVEFDYFTSVHACNAMFIKHSSPHVLLHDSKNKMFDGILYVPESRINIPGVDDVFYDHSSFDYGFFTSYHYGFYIRAFRKVDAVNSLFRCNSHYEDFDDLDSDRFVIEDSLSHEYVRCRCVNLLSDSAFKNSSGRERIFNCIVDYFYRRFNRDIDLNNQIHLDNKFVVPLHMIPDGSIIPSAIFDSTKPLAKLFKLVTDKGSSLLDDHQTNNNSNRYHVDHLYQSSSSKIEPDNLECSNLVHLMNDLEI
eukprot:NODE_43_length_2314_cov_359.003974_g37_i0.p1 GENE.NODE_43_length_2314_cov_359.003974_g37_i0~~NODE_43_length_2314_cov_359.003974_g37_i0.p1  ORF type:complete len:719 (+),score=-73.51 NODE_43_length_2314_cov_359.003974_g37_i0:51-2207(+)